MKLSSWLAICALLISSLALGMGTVIADKDEKDENRVEEGTGGAQHAGTEGDGAVDEDDDWDDREDEWDDEDDEDDEEMDR